MAKQNPPTKNKTTATGPITKNSTEPKKLTPKQQAMRRRQAIRRRNQIVLVGLGVVVVAIVAIIAILALSTPNSFQNISTTANPDIERMTIGGADAKVTLVEYGDLRCTACKSYFDNNEAAIRSEFVTTGRIKYVFKTLPVIDTIVGDSDSTRAGEALECAADQNRGWDYRDAAYKNYVGEITGKLNDKFLKDMASAIGLNSSQFNSCLDSSKNKTLVAQEKADAASKKLNSTPSFVLKYSGKEEVVTLNNLTELQGKVGDVLKSVEGASPTK